MGDFRKNILQTDFERKKSCKEIPAIQWLCMSGKKILSPEVCEKNSYAKQITHIPLKSQMVGPLPISLLTSFGAVSTT